MRLAHIQPDDAAREVAQRFVAARLAGRATQGYPGTIPDGMAEAYAIQDAAIGLYPGRVVGWKVGGVPPGLQETLRVHRVAGAIFDCNVWGPATGEIAVPGIPGGFTAVEAEFVARIGGDVDPARMDWSLADAIAEVDAVFIGVEIAGSPLSEINDLGSAVVASDFGNNAGLIMGLPVPDWRERIDAIQAETIVNGVSLGTGGAQSLAGGAMESVRFLLEHCTRWGRPLTAGTLISTGAVTGVHRVAIGDRAVCDFRGIGQIRCRIEKARPRD